MSRDIIVVGASAGGVEALTALVAPFPADLPAALFIALHIPPHSPSVLPRILERKGGLPTTHPADGEAIRHGRIYIAPPDRHLLICEGHVKLSQGPRENGSRPAADPMFRTAARSYGPRVIGVVLTGALDDGTAGLAAIKVRGGIGVAQSPATAMYPDMPQSAIDRGVVDHVADLEALPALLMRLMNEPGSDHAPSPDERVTMRSLDAEDSMTELDPSMLNNDRQPGVPSDFTCPDCGGVLRLIDQPKAPPHFRCQVGHAWAFESLQAAQLDRIEDSLWAALRALEENAKLGRRMLQHALDHHLAAIARSYEERIAEAERHAAVLRDLLLKPRREQSAP